jgi:hypothetical protein
MIDSNAAESYFTAKTPRPPRDIDNVSTAPVK